jgi:hypothetical protein
MKNYFALNIMKHTDEERISSFGKFQGFPG